MYEKSIIIDTAERTTNTTTSNQISESGILLLHFLHLPLPRIYDIIGICSTSLIQLLHTGQ
jgi:hypothetical protein